MLIMYILIYLFIIIVSCSHDNLHVKLCNQDVHIVSKEIYLGNYISENIYDRAIKQTVCAFNAKSNQIISDFSMLDCFSLHKLHTTYFMGLYGCEIWNYNSRYISEIWNTSLFTGYLSDHCLLLANTCIPVCKRDTQNSHNPSTSIFENLNFNKCDFITMKLDWLARHLKFGSVYF